jgi:hypothetical protein
LGPLGTAATNRPIVPAAGDYEEGEIGGMIGRGNRSSRRKPAPVPLCPPQTPHATRTRNRVVIWDLGWTKWCWGRFSRSTSVSPANLHSTNFSIITLAHYQGWYNRPVVASVPKVPPHKLKKKTLQLQRVLHRNRYIDWLRDGRPRGRRSSPGSQEFLFSTSSIPALESTQLPI